MSRLPIVMAILEPSMTAAARFDLRLDEKDKVREAVLREAAEVVATARDVSLSEAESRRFLKALDAPFRPNARLKKALQRRRATE